MKQFHYLCLLILFLIVTTQSNNLSNSGNGFGITNPYLNEGSMYSFLEKNIFQENSFSDKIIKGSSQYEKKKNFNTKITNNKFSQTYNSTQGNNLINNKTIYLPKAKEKIIFIRVPVLIAFYANLERHWMQKFRQCKNKNLYKESLLKYFIYFNKEKIFKLNLQMKRILDLLENFKIKKEKDNSETLALKYFSMLSNDSSKKQTCFFALEKILEHMKNSNMPFSLLKRFASKKDFLSYSMTDKRMELMLRYVIMIAKFFTTYERVNLTITPENYEKLRLSILRLMKKIVIRNKQKGIKNINMYRLFLKRKFKNFNKSKPPLKKTIQINKSYKSKNNLKYQFIDLSDIDLSPQKITSLDIKLDSEEQTKNNNKKQKNSKNKQIKNANKIKKKFSKDKINIGKRKSQTNISKRFILNKTQSSYNNNKILVHKKLKKLSKRLKSFVLKNKLIKSSMKKKRKTLNNSKGKKFNRIKKLDKKKINNKNAKNKRNLNKNKTKKGNENSQIIRDIETDKNGKSKLGLDGLPFFNENLKLRSIYADLITIDRFIKRNIYVNSSRDLKVILSKITSRLANINSIIKSIMIPNAKYKLIKIMDRINKFIIKTENTIYESSKNKIKECERKSKDLLEDYDFYSSDASKLNDMDDAEKFGNN